MAICLDDNSETDIDITTKLRMALICIVKNAVSKTKTTFPSTCNCSDCSSHSRHKYNRIMQETSN